MTGNVPEWKDEEQRETVRALYGDRYGPLFSWKAQQQMKSKAYITTTGVDGDDQRRQQPGFPTYMDTYFYNASRRAYRIHTLQ